MGARDKTRKALDGHIADMERSNLGGLYKQAGLPDDVQLAGQTPKKASGLDNEMGGHLKREIPKDYEYNPKALKPLARTLWAMSVALGHAITAHKQFTKVKSSTISPDGLVGGRGYVMSIKDVRKSLYDACENLSTLSDTIHDELNAPHWKPRLAELEKNDVETVERLVGEAEQLMDNPNGEVQDEMSEAEEEGRRVDLDGDGVGEAPRSDVPDGKDLADNYAESPQVKQASEGALLDRVMARVSNSSVPPETLPGPRVEDLDRTNDDDLWVFQEPRGYDYPSGWDNEVESPTAIAESALPADQTPSEAYDFGLGLDGHGQGVEDAGSPHPHTHLPDAPQVIPTDGTTPQVELSVGKGSWKTASTTLPLDVLDPVARSDYYPDTNTTRLSDSEVPAPFDADYDHGLDAQPGLSERHEQSQPYIKWDSDTKNMRQDYTYQREVGGPYVEQEG